MGEAVDLCCLVVLPRLQAVHSLHHLFTSLAAPFHTNRDVRSRLVARIPGWARLWTALKIACLSATGTKGLTWPEEVSHKRETPCTGIGCT
jgi:hypothetical protein